MLFADMSLTVRFGGSLPHELRPLWDGLVRTQLYIVVVTGLGSLAMAWLVARMINRPVQGAPSGDAERRAGAARRARSRFAAPTSSAT
jgi:peptidoglycan/LPS O-acetylase OafA/YrhL